PPDAARLLERLEDGIERGETTRHPLRHHRRTREDAVTGEELLGEGLRARGARTFPRGRSRQARPAADGAGRRLPAGSEGRTPRGSTCGRGRRGPQVGAQRSRRVVRGLPRPYQVPERVEDRARESAGDGGRE